MKILVTVILTLLLAVPASADPLFEGGDDPLGSMIKGGVALGGLGFTSGFFLSAKIEDLDVYHDDVTDPFYIGSGFGALGLATGVHLGNDRQGNWLLTTLTSGLVGAAGAKIIADRGQADHWLAVVPVFQLAATITVENLTTPGRHELQQKNAPISGIGLAPTPDGGCFLIRGTF